ncbi:MAG: GspE/PulE family protein [Cellulosilyticaceae bacterium]
MENNEYLKWGIESVDLSQIEIEESMAHYIPEAIARRHQAVAISNIKDCLQVAMNNPLDLGAIEELKFVTGKNIEAYKAEVLAIQYCLENLYRKSNTKKAIESIENQVREDRPQGELPIKAEKERAPVIEMVNNLFAQAISARASDIHIEQNEKSLQIRARVDGVLQKIMTLPAEVAPNIVARIKILAKLDIAEKRLPQDGRLTYTLENQKIDVRISTLPTYFGEKVVVRLIYPMEDKYCLENLGFTKNDFTKVERMLNEASGIILVTGPTGCGKTTTLAAMLRSLDHKKNNIVTIEDPIENVIEGTTQSAVNTKIGYTFARALRAILRQDPDVMMIGEIRDAETSSIAIRAAITGHLVLSTLHTNDAKTAITRLIDMGSEPYMVKAAVKGIIAQRLIRRICPYCRQAMTVTDEEYIYYRIPKDTILYKGMGCSFCNHTGYRGRIGIYEVLIPAMKQKDTAYAMLENAHTHMIEGATTLEEYLKIASEVRWEA